MNVELDQIKVSLTQQEVWDIIFALRSSIIKTIQEHWKNWIEDRTLEEFTKYIMKQESVKYSLVESFCNILDRRELLEEINYAIQKVYKENKKQ